MQRGAMQRARTEQVDDGSTVGLHQDLARSRNTDRQLLAQLLHRIDDGL